jgi:hypothetical protein
MKPRPRPKPIEPPADDSIEPALTTPRRLAGEIERIAAELGRLGLRLRRTTAYLDHAPAKTLAEEVAAVAGRLADLSGEVLVGRVAIVAGRDEAAGRERYPLIAAIEANGNGNGHPAEPPSMEAPDEPLAREPDLSAIQSNGRKKPKAPPPISKGSPAAKLIHALHSNDPALLAEAEAEIEVATKVKANAPPLPNATPEGNWRAVNVEDMSLNDSLQIALRENGIRTAGDLERHLERNPEGKSEGGMLSLRATLLANCRRALDELRSPAIPKSEEPDEPPMVAGIYPPSHPWYYKLGGLPLAFEAIEPAQVMPNEIEEFFGRLPKDPERRVKKLLGSLALMETDHEKAIDGYQRLVDGWPDGRSEPERHEDEAASRGTESSNSYHDALAFSYNGIRYSKGQIAALKSLLPAAAREAEPPRSPDTRSDPRELRLYSIRQPQVFGGTVSREVDKVNSTSEEAALAEIRRLRPKLADDSALFARPWVAAPLPVQTAQDAATAETAETPAPAPRPRRRGKAVAGEERTNAG